MPGLPLPSGGQQTTTVQQNEVAFSNYIAGQTKLDPRVVYSWASIEGAYAKGGTGGLNFLNLRPESGDPYASVSSGGFEQFSSLADAEAATLRRLREPFAAPILASAGSSPATEISAIASTGWDAGHYGGAGGPRLADEFAALFGKQQLGSAAQPAPITSGGGAGGSSPGTGTGSIGLPSWLTGSLLSTLGIQGSVDKLLIRGAELLAGGVLVILGVLMIGRAATLSSPAVATASAVRTAKGAIK